MWYEITCPDCGRKITTFSENDETAIKTLAPLLEKHDQSYQHRDPNLEKTEYDVEYMIRHNFAKSIERDQSAYEY